MSSPVRSRRIRRPRQCDHAEFDGRGHRTRNENADTKVVAAIAGALERLHDPPRPQDKREQPDGGQMEADQDPAAMICEVPGDLRSVIEARVARRHKPGDPQHDEGYSTKPGGVIEARLSHLHRSSINYGRWRPNWYSV